jgi:hypothetical protein
MLTSIKELFQIISLTPATAIYHFNDSNFLLTQERIEFSTQHACELFVATTNETLFASLESQDIKHRRIYFEQKRYNYQSAKYDYLFVNIDTDALDMEMFLTKCYRIMKNGANIVLFIAPSQEDFYRMKLEELNYVAINSIALNGQTPLAMVAKKMHGWKRV